MQADGKGVEGSLISYDEGFDPLDEDQRLQGAKWKVDPSLGMPNLSSRDYLADYQTPLCYHWWNASYLWRHTIHQWKHPWSLAKQLNSEWSAMPYAAVSAQCSKSAISHSFTIELMIQEYKVLVAQLESLFLSSSTFTLQTLYYHLHPTIHTMSLLSSLCLSLETEGTSKDVSGESESSDDDFGGKADELGLGGAALKGIMDVMNAKQGVVPGSDVPAGEVIGGEVLGIICERESTMSGYVPFIEQG